MVHSERDSTDSAHRHCNDMAWREVQGFLDSSEMISESEIFSDTDDERRHILCRLIRAVSFPHAVVLRLSMPALITSDTIESPHFGVSKLN